MTSSETITLSALTNRVSTMEGEVKQLREEFDDFRQESAKADRDMALVIGAMDTKLDRHVLREDVQYAEQKGLQLEQSREIAEVQKSVLQIATDLKEPLEVYKVAKYGARGTQLLASFIRSIWPLAAGILLGVMAFQYKATGQAAVNIPHAQQGK